jgi:hypothetical protein
VGWQPNKNKAKLSLYTTIKSDATFVLEEPNRHGFQTWGLAIYRASYYDDNSVSEQFIERMKEFARQKPVCSANAGPDGKAIWGKLQ